MEFFNKEHKNELDKLTFRPKHAINETNRCQGDYLTDERFAVLRSAIINSKPVSILMNRENHGANCPETPMLANLFATLQKAHLVPIYIEQTVYERDHSNTPKNAIKDERRIVNAAATSANGNALKLDADILVLLRKACTVKGIDLTYWQEAGKSSTPVVVMRQNQMIGLIMPIAKMDTQAAQKREKRENKKYRQALKDGVPEVDYHGQIASQRDNRKPYRHSDGRMRFPISMIESAVFGNDHLGFCLQCGGERDGCEPDASKYECFDCGTCNVYGAENVVIMGYTF